MRGPGCAKRTIAGHQHGRRVARVDQIVFDHLLGNPIGDVFELRRVGRRKLRGDGCAIGLAQCKKFAVRVEPEVGVMLAARRGFIGGCTVYLYNTPA